MSATWRTLDDFSIASEAGGERAVIRRLALAVDPLALAPDTVDRLSTAVAETVMNAIEHGNHNDPTLPVDITVRTDDENVEVLVSDNGGLRALPDTPELPDLDAKLAGLQRPRGWGLFLVRSMVDAMDVVADPGDPTRHTARLRQRIDAAAPHRTELPRPTQEHSEESGHAQHL